MEIHATRHREVQEEEEEEEEEEEFMLLSTRTNYEKNKKERRNSFTVSWNYRDDRHELDTGMSRPKTCNNCLAIHGYHHKLCANQRYHKPSSDFYVHSARRNLLLSLRQEEEEVVVVVRVLLDVDVAVVVLELSLHSQVMTCLYI
ncbi:hypothetical protein C0J52_17595 [Blattella germanica]|nr:hypothetical protein C0J52_17595 [Blattella germanica]